VSDDSAKIVSVSYGTCEDGESTQMMNEENTVLQTAAAQGKTFFVSSGDTGSEACNGGSPYGFNTDANPTAQAVDTSTGTLYVANEGSDSVSVVDEASDSVVATVPTGTSPDAIDFDSATSEVFVANFGSNSLTTFSTATCPSSNTSYTVNGVAVASQGVQLENPHLVSINTPVNVSDASSLSVVITGVTNPSGDFASTGDFSVSTIADRGRRRRAGWTSQYRRPRCRG
jgi:YVTN family beta-propeller protein